MNDKDKEITTPKKKIKKIVEINSGKKKEENINFKNTEFYKNYEKKEFTDSLVKKFNKDSQKLNTGEIENKVNTFAKSKREEQEKLINEQAKIFNKILWIKIISERIIKDNESHTLQFISKKNQTKKNNIEKMKQEVYKTSNYLEIVEK